MKIESHDQDLSTLLSSAYYRIPRFQRPYSWDKENIQEFWDDVVRDTPADYFLGSMVLYKDGHRLGVVDGQQRLTTVTIFLCVLRNALNEIGQHDLASGVHGLVERRTIDNKSEFVLSTETSYPYFQSRIQSRDPQSLDVKVMKEEKCLQSAFEQLTQLVAGVRASVLGDPSLGEQARVDALKDKLVHFRDALLGLKVIVIKLEDADDAYVIFETLNTRGKDLSLKDLVKNHLVKYIKSGGAEPDQAKLLWDGMLATIESSSADVDVDTFLHHFWLSRYEYLPAKTVFKSLKKQVGQSEAPAFLRSLVSDAKLYRSAVDKDYREWAKDERVIARALGALNLFRVKQPAPCVLSLLRGYDDGRLKRRQAESALVAIERFHFLFTAITSQHSSGGISAMYAALARRIHQARDAAHARVVIDELLAKLRERVPARNEFDAGFESVVYTDSVTKQKRLVKYILSHLHSLDTPSTVADYDMMTIEHLAPQSHVGKLGLTGAAVGQLGNLLLVSSKLNEKLKTKAFVDKRKILKEAGYPLDDEVLQAEVWDKDSIARRTKALAKKAYDVGWKL